MQPVRERDRPAKARARRQRAAQVKRRRLVLVAFVVVLLVVAVVLATRSCGGGAGASSTTTRSTSSGATSSTFTAELTGAGSVPAVDTQAAAKLTLQYDSAAKEIAFTLEVTSQISNPTLATIYQGQAGEHGDAVCTLFAGPAKVGDFKGTLAQGTIVADDLIGTLEGGTVADLAALIEQGKTFVNISNQSHPVDAIRGPIS